jgi:3'-phosphoadenosine 5'-phosphosulfate sulfotransferase (PAPS reductase)/FAD synthetase
MRAQESDKRANMPHFSVESSNTVRHVDRWLAIQAWSEEQVWNTIRFHQLPYHEAYDLGMERLSCVFCPLASKADLVIAAQHNPELAQEYLALEELVGHAIKEPQKGAPLSMADIIAAAQRAQKVSA